VSLDPTSVPAKLHLNTANGLSSVHVQTSDDRQTDHATEKYLGMGGITCSARAIPLNDNNNLAYIAPVCQKDSRDAGAQFQSCVTIITRTRPKCCPSLPLLERAWINNLIITKLKCNLTITLKLLFNLLRTAS